MHQDEASRMRAYTPIRAEDHPQLVDQVPEILRRLNDNPQHALLLLVNPILALEDLGVTVAPELETHLRNTLGFPKPRVEQIVRARERLRAQLKEALGESGPVRLPKGPRERAQLVFETLKLPPRGQAKEALTVEELRPYRKDHPLVHAMYELGRLERGALLYESRATYEAHKAGRPHHPWLARPHFRKGD